MSYPATTKLLHLSKLPLDVYHAVKQRNKKTRNSRVFSMVVFLTEDSSTVIIAKGQARRYISAAHQVKICEAFNCTVIERIPIINLSFIPNGEDIPHNSTDIIPTITGITESDLLPVFHHHPFFLSRKRDEKGSSFRGGTFAFFQTLRSDTFVWARDNHPYNVIEPTAFSDVSAKFLFKTALYPSDVV